ncbi:hypothetical protein NDU88_001689 [Pleurodeles waltl]|uniref:Uncharacterized protein n=1 Tax=Pleurodeles waltl TaxID=8319 RepID=A0AAV7P4K7_PLEWA|nr:hypothetical protein NDU88_001689 [Pleurodeles waltl]
MQGDGTPWIELSLAMNGVAETRRPCGASGGRLQVESRGGHGPTDPSSVCALLGRADTLLSSVERTGRDIALELQVEAENRGQVTREEAWTWLEDRSMASGPSHPPSRSAKRGPRRVPRDGHTQVAPTAKQASVERDLACVEVERRVGSPASSVRSVDHQDADHQT